MPRAKYYRPIPQSLIEDWEPQLNAVPPGAQALLMRLYCVCDDAGCFYGEPERIKGHCYAMAPEVSVALIRDWLSQLADPVVGLIQHGLDAEGRPALRIIAFVSSCPKRPRNRYPMPEISDVRRGTMPPAPPPPPLFTQTPGTGNNGNAMVPVSPSRGTNGESLIPVSPLRTRIEKEKKNENREPRTDDGHGYTGVKRLLHQGKGREATELFAQLVLDRIKPPDQVTNADRDDVLAFALKQFDHDPDRYLPSLRRALTVAERVHQTDGGYGMWRAAMAREFGPWSRTLIRAK